MSSKGRESRLKTSISSRTLRNRIIEGIEVDPNSINGTLIVGVNMFGVEQPLAPAPPPDPPPNIAPDIEIDPMMVPRGLPIVVRQGLVVIRMRANLPRFTRSRNEDHSAHIERFEEHLISNLIVNTRYYHTWVPTTLIDSAYLWYRTNLQVRCRVERITLTEHTGCSAAIVEGSLSLL